MEFKLTIPVPTSVNKLYINQYIYDPKARRRVPSGAKILSKEGEKRKKEIQLEAVKEMKKQKDWNYENTLDKNNFYYLDTTIYFPRKGCDDDNIYKILKDSLEKIVYDNDSRILVRTQRVYFDRTNPRVELKITPVDYLGVFDSSEEYENFRERCNSCNRYRDGRCSILVDSYSAVVREEIDLNKKCLSYKEKKS